MSGIVTPPPPYIPPTTISDPATFRSHFPPFANTATYPDASVQFFLNLGAVLCGPRWCELRQAGVELVCAHFLALQQYNAQRSAGGVGAAVPGMGTGLLQSKSVSKVSVGYNLDVTAIEGGGPWNYTMYGQQYLWFLDFVGMGAFEMLSIGVDETLVGLVSTWARGVQLAWGS